MAKHDELPDYAKVEEDLPDYAKVEDEAPVATAAPAQPTGFGATPKADLSAWGATKEPTITAPKESHPYQDFMRSVLNKFATGITAGHADELGAAVTTGLQRAHILNTPASVRYDLDSPRPDGTAPHERSIAEQYRVLRGALREDQNNSDEKLGLWGKIPELAGSVALMNSLGLNGTGYGDLAKTGLVIGGANRAGNSTADLTKGEIGKYAEDVGSPVDAAIDTMSGPLLKGGAESWGGALRDAGRAIYSKYGESAFANWLKNTAAELAVRSVGGNKDLTHMLGPLEGVSMKQIKERTIDYGKRMLNEVQSALGGEPITKPFQNTEAIGERFGRVEQSAGKDYGNVLHKLDQVSTNRWKPGAPPPELPALSGAVTQGLPQAVDQLPTQAAPEMANTSVNPVYPLDKPTPSMEAERVRNAFSTDAENPMAAARQEAREAAKPKLPPRYWEPKGPEPRVGPAANPRVEMPTMQEDNSYLINREKWFQDAHEAIDAKYSAESDYPERNYLHRELEKMQENSLNDSSHIKLSDMEANKQGHYGRVNYRKVQSDMPEALKWLANGEKQTSEAAAERIANDLAPELKGEFERTKDLYGFATGGADTASDAMGRALKNRIFNPTSKAMGMASQIGTEGTLPAKTVKGLMATIGAQAVADRTPSTLAYAMNGIGKFDPLAANGKLGEMVVNNAGALGKFAGVLQRAAVDGPDAFDRTVAFLRKNYPEFSKLEESLGGAPQAADESAR